MYQESQAALLSLFLLAVPAFCSADIIQVVDEDFNEPLNAFFLSPFASENATAGITLGDVAGSQGVIYTGTWQISPETVDSSQTALKNRPSCERASLSGSWRKISGNVKNQK